MSSIQERLQLKRVPLDTWNVREQLCLASAVARSGDQNWMSVSRALKAIGDPNRPPDWYSQKSCAAQYGVLLENVETPKRKKRNSEGAGETAQESILKRLTQERIAEIQKNVADMNAQYQTLKTEIAEIQNPLTTEDRLKELWTTVETSMRAKERETAKHAAWLREREERRARAERNWRPPTSVVDSNSSPNTPSSPLLTSLLKSSPVVTTPQHISHPANVVETISPSAGAPTLSMLLEKSPSDRNQHDNKHAAIEHIKNQLVQIEQQLKEKTSQPEALPVDIDDIEIKAEDVYAFRDVDIEIPPVVNIHRPPPPLLEKLKKEDETPDTTQDVTGNQTGDESMQVDITAMSDTSEEINVETTEEAPPAEEAPPILPPPEPVKISFPEVKFPTLEIKFKQAEEKPIKEEVKEPEEDVDVEVEKMETEEVVVAPPPVEENVTITESEPVEATEPTAVEPEATVDEPVESTEVTVDEIPMPDLKDIPLPPGEPIEAPPPPPPPVPEEIPEPPKVEETPPVEEKVEEIPPVAEVVQEESKETEQVQMPPPETEVLPQKEETQQFEVKEEKEKEVKAEVEETHTETDDDTPMEVVREEERDGKKKRDYSRKKKPNSRTCSGSESNAEVSAPESPTTSDLEKQHRLWKKSVMLVYSRLCAHKYASLFLRPITDEHAPGYSVVIKRPMDLSTIKKNIESGVIKSTAEFQRDVLLMLTNALMYNSTEHRVYQMAKEMFKEAKTELDVLIAAQAHAGLSSTQTRRPRRADRHNVTH